MDQATVEQLIAEMTWVRRLAQDLVRDDAILGDLAQDSEPAFTPADLVERTSLRRVIADEVLVLHEPYRSIVLLHFLSGISEADLALRLEIPADYVRERLKCAFEQLRVALRQRSDQPNRGWIASLVRLGTRL